MKQLSTLATFLTLSISTNMSLACTPPEKPELPDPATAVTPQMVKAKNDVTEYLAAAETYLKCKISTNRYNAMVDDMHEVADRFNSIVQAYKARMSG